MKGRTFDTWERIEKRLEKYPTVKKLFGKEWIQKQVENDTGHSLPWLLSRDLPQDKINQWHEQLQKALKEGSMLRAAGISMSLNHVISQPANLIHLENCLEELKNTSGIKSIAKKMRNNDEAFWDTFNEIEVCAYLNTHNPVQLEPPVSNGCKLDAKAVLGKREVYFEVITVHLAEKLNTSGVAAFVKNRLKDKALDKCLEQITNVPHGFPVILVVPLGYGEIDSYDIDDMILGTPNTTIRFDDKGKGVQAIDSREHDSLLDGDKTACISAVLSYKRHYDFKGNTYLFGNLNLVLYAANPLDTDEINVIMKLFKIKKVA